MPLPEGLTKNNPKIKKSALERRASEKGFDLGNKPGRKVGPANDLTGAIGRRTEKTPNTGAGKSGGLGDKIRLLAAARNTTNRVS